MQGNKNEELKKLTYKNLTQERYIINPVYVKVFIGWAFGILMGIIIGILIENI